ncbi:MAG: epoxide hydrolase [Mesorhizobium sp.]|uniref:epoxide hydrolase family protein n=1 Tax=Mesorhizobium sp. TaxID=1871066 RepID=UPI000FE42629|nr:epoxide hydrolase family protein [Mesorhizobium sp.]RWG81484.1 MAG: epoxide hydrolase [Mesorhizobium sp.]RWK17396.1 MAG: epoxide hydrolase [Mesorhizobium sp.]RWK28253.1 MAG: epoxide hydrolase [Mesorhizobium sp.]TIQ39054.1 MAG: epoxide hydrolase [Mesorhizobium sp.]
MSAISPTPNRRELLAAAAVAGAFGLLPGTLRAAAGDDAIRPFTVNIPQAEIDELRRRIAATRWSDRETVNDQSQGIRLEKLRPLVEYWGSGYDWRKAEAKLNSLPQFMSTVDGLDIHFIHVRSKHPNAMPLIMTHGWPGSVFELLKTVGPLSDPTAHGGAAEDAFDLVLPSMPGFGFSGKPTEIGWGPDRIARAWGELMKRLRYNSYVAQGGDWGSPVSSAMARQAPTGLLGIHINLPAVVPPEIAAVLAAGGPVPAGLTDKERTAFDALSAAARMGNRSYAVMMGKRPQTIGYSTTDSPAGLAAWMLGHPGFSHWTYDDSDPEKSPGEVLDDISLYWLTNTATSSARIYWEYGGGRSPAFSAPEMTAGIALPVAITVFPGESYQAPETWARRAYRKLTYFHEVDKGGHFAAWEEPELFSAELRAAFRSLRQSI